MPKGHIISQACNKESGSTSVCSVSFSVLIAAADLSFPRGLCERTEMWCCYSDTSRGGVCLGRPRCVSLLWPPTTPPPPIFPEHRDFRRQARCNCSLRYAGRMLWPLPRTSPAPEIEWHGSQNPLYLRESSSECSITERWMNLCLHSLIVAEVNLIHQSSRYLK